MTTATRKTAGVPALLKIVGDESASRSDRQDALKTLVDGYSDNPLMSGTEKRRTLSDLALLARVHGLN